MRKVRVYQLAKELEVPSALILELLDRMGQEVKSDLDKLEAETANVVRQRVTAALEAEKQKLQSQEPAGAEADAPAADTAVAEAPAAESTATPADEQPQPVAAEAPAATEAPAADKPAATEAPAAAAAPPAPARPETARPAPSRPESPRPVAARGDAPTAPGGRPPARPAPRPGGPKDPAAPRAAAPGGAKPGAPGAPGARKPRVFEAKRIPTQAELNRTLRGRGGGPGGGPGGPGGPAGRGAPGGRSGGRFGPPPGGGPGGMPPAGPGGFKPGGPPPPGRGAPPKKRRKKDRSKNQERTAEMPVSAKPKPDLPPVPEEITLSEGVTVKELAEKLNRKSKDVIAKLIGRGVLATINQPLDPEMAVEVALEFGSVAEVLSFEEEAQKVALPEVEDTGLEERTENLQPRPPVVTVMGHVDHGKTSLLDALRQSNVASGEAGGITQHIGAYQVEAKGQRITFLDTPGHEAFTLMRSRGAKATDVVVLVVAADDGVKPQTLEAIDHAKAAKVPLVVAINKIDKPGANSDRVKQQLMERELVVEDYGGDIVACEVSAKQQTGLDHLLEMILLVSELKEPKADPEAPATGVVLESRLDRGRGILATVLVQSGTLKPGDAFIAGTGYGKVRAMNDENGKRVDAAGPSTPIEVMGFNAQPNAGDSFQEVKDEAKARQISQFRSEKLKAEQAGSSARFSLEQLSAQIAEGKVKEFPLILKCDVQGSIEALQKTLDQLPQDKVRVKVLSTGVGAISQADVLLATASDALIIGFNVRPDRTASDLAAKEKIEIRMYTVIYDLVDDVRAAMVGLLEPTIKETVLGQAEVRNTFKISRIGTIAGCYVRDGKVTRNAEVRLLRDNVVIHTGRISTLRRFKDDVAEVKNGFECGIHIQNYNDVKVDDVIEFFIKESIAAESL